MPRINRAYQSGLFQAPIKSTNKEYRDLCERLEIVDRILTKGGLEFEFAADYVEQIRQTGIRHSGNPNFEMKPKAVERYTLNSGPLMTLYSSILVKISHNKESPPVYPIPEASLRGITDGLPRPAGGPEI